MTQKSPPTKKSWSWRSQAFRGLVYQLISIALVGLGVWWLASNTMHNMQVRGIQSGFDFLTGPAGFDIGESLFPFDSAEPYWQAFLVGLANTLRVAIIGIILTTILGTLLGIGRFSRNALVRGLCYAYVEFFRNVPVLLQLLMWYLLFTEVLPAAQDAWTLGPLFLSKGGLSFPIPIWELGHLWGVTGLVAGALLAWLYRRWSFSQFEATGKLKSMFIVPLAIFVVVGVLAWFAGGGPAQFNFPIKGDFSIEQGGSLTPRVPVGAARPDRLHRRFRGRSRAGGHQFGVPRPGRGIRCPGPEPGADHATGDAAAGAARDHPADDQPVPEPHQELLARRGHRLPGRGVDCQHGPQPDRTRGGMYCHRDAGLPDHLAHHVAAHELVQHPFGDQGTLKAGPPP
jgi:His/Glu/Gln/Arg/opine family amino acid ABC transporter permease subunit